MNDKRQETAAAARLKRNGAVVVIALASGSAWLAFSSAGPVDETRALSPGDEVVLEVQPDESGQVHVTGIRESRSGEGDPADALPKSTVLVPTGSVWKYLDGGVDPGPGWRAPGFDDSAWPEGAAELGFGDGDEATVLDGGPPENRHLTFYFRRRFSVGDDPESLGPLTLRLRRDDGAVVYIGGAEVFRTNMAPWPTDHAMRAAVTQNGADESRFFTTEVRNSALVRGDNVIAVEVHQVNPTSSDVSFDLELRTGPVAIEPQPVFRGRVIDSESGEPIAGVRAAWSSGWRMSFGPGGRFLGVRLRRAGEVENIPGPDFLSRAAPEARLPFANLPGRVYRADSYTGEDGVFELPERQPEDALFLMADGYLPWSPALEDGFTANGTSDESVLPVELLEFPLVRARYVRGRLVTADGSTPLRGSDINLSAEAEFSESGWTASWPVEVAEDMTFECAVGNTDTVRLLHEVDGFVAGSTAVRITALEQEVDVVLEPHARIGGVVIDGHGVPVEEAFITVKSRKKSLFRRQWQTERVQSNESGRFLVNVYGPLIEVEVVKRGYANVKLTEVEQGREDLQVLLEETEKGRVEGRVVDERGDPIAGVRVIVARANRDGEAVRVQATTDESGAFQLELWPDRYSLSFDVLPITEPGGWVRTGVEHASVERELEIVPGTTGEFLEVVVPDGATVIGRVTGDDGSPAAGKQVYLYRPDLLGGRHETVNVLATDADGQFEFRGLPAGTYSVYAAGKHHLVRVADRQTAEVDVGGSGATVAGTVRRGGEPVARAQIAIGRVRPTLGELQRATTDEDGAFRVRGLRPGTHLVHINDTEREAAMIAVCTVEGEDVELPVEWPNSTLMIRVGEKPLPAETRLVVEWLEAGGVALEGVAPPEYRVVGEAQRAADGSYTLTGIGPGRYRVRTEGAEDPRSVEVEVGEEDAEVTLE